MRQSHAHRRTPARISWLRARPKVVCVEDSSWPAATRQKDSSKGRKGQEDRGAGVRKRGLRGKASGVVSNWMGRPGWPARNTGGVESSSTDG